MSYYDRDGITVHHGDGLDVLAELPDASVDAVATDPPYELAFVGRTWDATGIAYNVDLWRHCLRILKPGGHLLAFGGTRTWHRLAVAVEDAGFEIRDSIAWMFGSGFPKSLDVSKAIDKAAGAEREVKAWRNAEGGGIGMSLNVQCPECGKWMRSPDPCQCPRDNGPQTDAARTWQGWGTALKPGYEPVVWARKPFNPVPLDTQLVASVHHALAGLLWLSLSPAKRAELSSPSSRAEHGEAWCVSARVSAATDTSRDESVVTDTYSSPGTGSTFSNIATSWNSILGALSDPTRTCTTSTRSSMTTGLRTLNSLLAPVTSQTTMPPCGCLTRGPSPSATSAESGSSDDWSKWLHTLSASAPASAIEGIGLAVASALAQLAVDVSVDQEAASSAHPSATTSADESSSPAFEPVVVARKPLAGTVAANVLAHGTGALNIDGCRVEGAGAEAGRTRHGGGIPGNGSSFELPDSNGEMPAGRWPANVILDESQSAALDEAAGERPGFSTQRDLTARDGTDGTTTYGKGVGRLAPGTREGFNDSGGASRFFYTAKADAAERPKVNGTAHPTVKPLSLMQWLVRLVTPPGGVVLEPFAGSGTTVEACILEGFDCIAIEREADYLPLIEARITRRRDPARAVELSGEDMGLLGLLGEETA